jgi:type IV secretory pathway VirB4 component
MTLRHQPGFYSLLPDGRNWVRRPKKIDATTVAYTFPFASTDLSMEGGVLFGVNLRENSPVVVNLWKRPELSNPNVTIVGKAGSGKSFFVKLMAERQLLNGVKLFVIDVENEYDRLAAAAGGRSIYISPSRPFVFNPFELPSTADGRLAIEATNLGGSGHYSAAEDAYGDPLSEKAATLTALLSMMILGSNLGDSRGTEGLDRQGRDLLDRAIFETYRRCGITRDEIQSGRLTQPLLVTNTNAYADQLATDGGPENNHQIARDFRGPRIPGLTDLRDTLLDLADTYGLAGGLERYITGSFAGFFSNRPTQVSSKDYLTVFKIREVSPELQPLVIAMVMDWCWSLAVRERVPRQFICDELWSLMASVAGGELVEKFARRSRKLGLSLVVATQQVEDLLNSSQGRAVLSNCDTKWIGQQEADHRKILRESLALTEAQVSFVTNTASAGQALLKCGKRWVPLSVEHADYEYQFAETNPITSK